MRIGLMQWWVVKLNKIKHTWLVAPKSKTHEHLLKNNFSICYMGTGSSKEYEL